MVFNRKLKVLFNKAPSIYDSSRKGYSNKIFSDIIKESKINKKSRILDIGCGSGLSTIPLGKIGYKITGIDTSKNLIDLAKENSKQYKNINYTLGSFENSKLRKDQFNLLISGQAFHWLDKKTKYKKCFNILKKDGFLAIFGKFNDYNKSSFLFRIRKLFIRSCKYYPLDTNYTEYFSHYKKELESKKLFKNVQGRVYNTQIRYTKKDYRNYILSNSWVIKLEDKPRKNLMKKIDNLMNKETWPMSIPFGSALIIAQVKK